MLNENEYAAARASSLLDAPANLLANKHKSKAAQARTRVFRFPANTPINANPVKNRPVCQFVQFEAIVLSAEGWIMEINNEEKSIAAQANPNGQEIGSKISRIEPIDWLPVSGGIASKTFGSSSLPIKKESQIAPLMLIMGSQISPLFGHRR